MIELACMKWLRFENKCVIVLNERSPISGHGLPDVLGVTRSRYLKEIEVKRTMSDFRANAKKFHVQERERFLDRWPRQFYFAVPESLVEKAKAELPPFAGLIAVNGTLVRVEVDAPVNERAVKLSTQRCVRLAECMANQIACMSADALNHRGRASFCDNSLDDLYKHGWWTDDGKRVRDYCNYQI